MSRPLSTQRVGLAKRINLIFDEPRRAQNLTSCYGTLNSNYSLLRFLACYVTFNSIFAAGVAALTSAVHIRGDLFGEKARTNRLIRDRSAEIASHIFHAAEDEYDVIGASKNVSHRTLAQRCLERSSSSLGIALSAFNDISRDAELRDFLNEVKSNYGIGASLDDTMMFRGLGFHLASEQCARQEFILFDGFLQTHYPQLVDDLTGILEPWGINGYHWIKVHCSVEEDHWREALQAIELALKYYVGRKSPQIVLREIEKGFALFTQLQERFFRYATDRKYSHTTEKKRLSRRTQHE